MSAKNCTTHHYACDCREAMHKADIDRKNKLLRDALEWLIACEWSITQSVIIAIEKELGVSENIDKN